MEGRFGIMLSHVHYIYMHVQCTPVYIELCFILLYRELDVYTPIRLSKRLSSCCMYRADTDCAIQTSHGKEIYNYIDIDLHNYYTCFAYYY